MNFKSIMSALAIAAISVTSALPAIAAPEDTDQGTGIWAFFQIQNTNDTETTVSMAAYSQEGAPVDDYVSQSYTVASGAAVAFHPGLAPNYPAGTRIGFTRDLADGFSGSAVISASDEVKAVATISNNESGTAGVAGGTAGAFYQGIGSASAAVDVNFPVVKNRFNSQTTYFYVQAAGEDANVTVTYNMNDGSEFSETREISANRMVIFEPSNAGVANSNCGAAATSPCLGAASASSSSGEIAAVVLEFPDGGAGVWPFDLATRGLTSDDAGTTLLAPVIKNAFNGGTTGFSVQNTGTTQAEVTIELKVTNASDSGLIGNVYNDSVQIPAGGAIVFSPARANLGGMPAGTFAAATVVSTNGQPLVGTVNESKDQAGTPGGKAKAVYAAFNTANASGEISAPLVKERFGSVEGTTGLVIANAGTGPTKFKATYIDQNGVTRVFETVNTYQPGQAESFFQVFNNPSNKYTAVSGFTDFGDLFGTNNAVSVESTTGENIVAIAQESDRKNGALDIKNYEGFNE